MVAILGYSREQIFAAVQDMYTRVAQAPGRPYHFPLGRELGRTLGYADEDLQQLPEATVDAFAGVGCPFRAGAVKPGDTCLDIGAGSGGDSLIAARRVGEDGRVVALDLTAAMTQKLQTAATGSGIDNLRTVQASAEALPLPDASVDCITSNGALNLVPDKRRAIREMFRVLKPGGRLQLADVVIRRPVTVDCDSDPRLWVECVVGATVEEELLALFREAGFEDIEVLRHIDYFALSPSAQTREIAAGFGARSVELRMRRGERAPGRFSQWLHRLNPIRLVARVWRRGWAGVGALVLALLTCYGLLVATGLLAMMGLGLALNETLWVGAITGFSLLTLIAILPGLRFHRRPEPFVLAGIGTGLVLYALFVDYHFLTELAGFLCLAAGVALDLLLRRRHQTRVLGLDKQLT